MMMSEFIDRTGFTPTYEEYLKIEEAYYNFDSNKDAFCKAFVEGNGEKKICSMRAKKIDQLKSQLVESDRNIKELTERYEQKIRLLQAQLDAELEWKPCKDCGTNMEQARYENLLNSGTSKKLTVEEAKQFIAEECGFDPDKIRIVTEVSTYEVNKYRQTRKSATFTREPVYESTDWNYVRFDCANFMYEFVNGEIRFYCC